MAIFVPKPTKIEAAGQPPKSIEELIGQVNSGTYLVLLAVIVATSPALMNASEIKKDETVVFFPTVAHLTEDRDAWVVPIHGWIYEQETDSGTRKAAMASIRKSLGLEPDQPSTTVFEGRVRQFLVDNERGKRIPIRIGDKTFDLEPSDQDGHFFATLHLDAQTVAPWEVEGRIRYLAVTDADDKRRFHGTIHLVRPAGVTVISDIDDTIKVTEVTDRKKMLENTFFRPFRAVEGMAELYRCWADEGAEFHFVSASPWQLYEPLAELTSKAGFPPATFHLRRVRLKDTSVLAMLDSPLEAKLNVIEPLIACFPQRRFILVGDSGERDPEVYGTVASRHPEQVLRVYIRDATGDAADSPRYQTVFRELPRDRWKVFRRAAEIRGDVKLATGATSSAP